MVATCCMGDMVQTLTQWWHQTASNEALDAYHQVMMQTASLGHITHCHGHKNQNQNEQHCFCIFSHPHQFFAAHNLNS